MTRPGDEAKDWNKGFQTGARRVIAEWHAHACVTLGLTLATTVAVITISIEIARAAAN